MNLKYLPAQWVATAYVGLVSLGLNIILARNFGPARFGDYGVALAAGALLGIVLDGGFKTLLLRERTLATGALALLVPRLHAVAIGHVLTVGLIAGVVAFAVFPEQRVLAIATVACFLGVALSQFVSGALRGEGRFVADAGWQAGTRTLSAITILAALAVGISNPAGVLLAWAFGSLTAVLFLPHAQTRRPRFEWHPEGYRAAAFLLWVDIATVIYFRADMLLLNVMEVSAEQVGQYAAAYRIIEAPILMTAPVAILIFRKLRLEQQNPQRLHKSLIKSLIVASLAGGIVAAGLSILAGALTSYVYGPDYSEAGGFLAALACALFFLLPNAVLTQAAIAMNRERSYAYIAATAAIFNISLNVWLIPRHGAMGAAWVTVATEAWLCVLLVIGAVSWCRGMNSIAIDKHASA